jgi:hypothetical protein
MVLGCFRTVLRRQATNLCSKLPDPMGSVSAMPWQPLSPDACVVLQGSFYANPCQDTYSIDPELVAKYPSYYRPNVWPRQHLPALEGAFKDLGQLVVRVGLLLAHHCNRWDSHRAEHSNIYWFLAGQGCLCS